MEQIKKTKIIAVVNQKGGVGKTTTVVNIAAGLAKRNKKVLAVDLDSQANLSTWLQFEHDGKPTIAELIVSSVGGMIIDFNNHIRHFEVENFDFIPAYEESLKGIPSYLASKNDCMNILFNVFNNDYFKKYDYIVFDCSPSSDLLVTNALAACDKLLIPVQTDMLSYEKVDKTLQTLVNIKKDTDVKKYLLGFLPTMYQIGTTHSESVYQALIDSYGDLVFNTYIPYLTEAKNATMYGYSSVSKNKSRIGQAYLNVVDTIIDRIEV